jgi:alpha-galactosidase
MPFSEESALRCVDVAAEIGTELFILDAYWWDVTPDWTPSRERFPKGLKPLISYVRDKGMRFGLYVEPEAGRAAGQLGNIEQSTVYQEHPDWFGVKNVLRLALPEAAAWMESEICRLIEAYELDLLRIDFNPHFTYGGLISREKGIWESEYWRYYETLYAIYDRVHARYPQLVLQQCAAGGGRNDLAMVRRFHENYLTDGLSLPRELQIYSGVTLGLPPELLRILHGADGMGIVGKPLNLDTILRVSCTLAPPQIFTGAVAPSLEELADSRLDRFKRYITLYKEFIRPDLAGSLVYHHEPVSAGGGVESSPWFCVEFVSPNRDKGWVVVVRMRNGRGDAYVYKYNGEKVDFSEGGELFGEGAEYIFRSRGLDPFKRYRVTYDSLDASGVMSGIEIRRGGLPVRLENAGMSELLRFEAE